MDTNTKKAIAILGTAAVGVGAVLYFTKDTPVDPNVGFATLWGTVQDSETGEKLEGINVSLGLNMITTDSNGKYEFVNIEPGSYMLVFTDPSGEYEMLEI